MTMFEVVPVGSKKFQRFAITDVRTTPDTPIYWTGLRDNPWSTDVRISEKWIDANDDVIALRIQEIIQHEYRHLPERQLELKIKVTYIGPPEVDNAKISEYLDRALSLGIDYNKEGSGPIIGSYVLISADVTSLIEGKEAIHKPE